MAKVKKQKVKVHWYNLKTKQHLLEKEIEDIDKNWVKIYDDGQLVKYK